MAAVAVATATETGVAGDDAAEAVAVPSLSSGDSTCSEEEDSGEDSEEMVFEEEVPEVAFVDPLVAQFGEDDGWYRNILDFVQ